MTLSHHEAWQTQINCKQLCLAKHDYTLQSGMPENSSACVNHIHCSSSDDRALIATLWVGVEYFDIFDTSVFWKFSTVYWNHRLFKSAIGVLSGYYCGDLEILTLWLWVWKDF